MASDFLLSGIKEVADVTFWNLVSGAPELYLDTLKVSTIEETAEQAEAKGGKGNSPLIIWDYGREINLTLEDALMSMKSMAIMHGASVAEGPSTISRTKKFFCTANGVADSSLVNAVYYNAAGASVAEINVVANEVYIAQWDEAVTGAKTLTISADSFPGTYKITGTTYIRDQATGVDDFFMFEIPQAKINPEQTITMEAEGDPSVFSMSVRVLRPSNGEMMKLIRFPKA